MHLDRRLGSAPKRPSKRPTGLMVECLANTKSMWLVPPLSAFTCPYQHIHPVAQPSGKSLSLGKLLLLSQQCRRHERAFAVNHLTCQFLANAACNKTKKKAKAV